MLGVWRDGLEPECRLELPQTFLSVPVYSQHCAQQAMRLRIVRLQL